MDDAMTAAATESGPIVTDEETVTDATASRRVRAIRRGRIETELGLPPRPKRPIFAESTAWMERAACGQPGVPEHDRDAHLTVDRQDEAWDLVARYCARCPVARLCLTDGRNVHGTGLYGGYVLADGSLAPDRYGDVAFRDPEAWTPQWEREELVPVEGITAREAARAACGQEPTSQQVENARKKLAIAVEVGRLTYVRDSDREAGRYYAVEPEQDPTEAVRRPGPKASQT